jgi:hypothetical protein
MNDILNILKNDNSIRIISTSEKTILFEVATKFISNKLESTTLSKSDIEELHRLLTLSFAQNKIFLDFILSIDSYNKDSLFVKIKLEILQ